MKRFLKWTGGGLAAYLALAVLMGELESGATDGVSRAELQSYGIDSVKAEFLANRFEWLVDSLMQVGGGTFYEDSLDDVTQAEAFQLGRRIGMRGLARLGSPEIQEFAAFEVEVLESATPEECARVARGRADSELAARLMAEADTMQLRTVSGLFVDAFVEEITSESSLPEPSGEQSNAAWSAFSAHLDPDERERFVSVIDSPGGASQENMCWSERTLWKILAQMPPEQGQVIYTQMAGTMSGASAR